MHIDTLSDEHAHNHTYAQICKDRVRQIERQKKRKATETVKQGQEPRQTNTDRNKEKMAQKAKDAETVTEGQESRDVSQ